MRYLKFIDSEHFFEKKSAVLIDDTTDLQKAIAMLRDAFQRNNGKTLIVEVYTPVVVKGGNVLLECPPKEKVNGVSRPSA